MVCCLRLDRSITGGLMSVYGWGGLGGGVLISGSLRYASLSTRFAEDAMTRGGVLPSKRLMEMCR